MNATVQLGVRGIRKEFVAKIKSFNPENATTEAWNQERNLEKNRLHFFTTEVVTAEVTNLLNILRLSFESSNEVLLNWISSSS